LAPTHHGTRLLHAQLVRNESRPAPPSPKISVLRDQSHRAAVQDAHVPPHDSSAYTLIHDSIFHSKARFSAATPLDRGPECCCGNTLRNSGALSRCWCDSAPTRPTPLLNLIPESAISPPTERSKSVRVSCKHEYVTCLHKDSIYLRRDYTNTTRDACDRGCGWLRASREASAREACGAE
jgi:hypothetical protein